MTVPELIVQLRELHKKADVRSRMLFENGREISDVDRARSEGYASAYSFCIMQLEKVDEAQ